MLRWPFVLLVAIGQCGSQAPPLAPDTAEVTEPPAVVVTSTSEEPTPKLPPVAPPAVHTNLGWVHDVDDPAAPIIYLTVVEGNGSGGDAGVDAIVGAAGDILSCWEAAQEDEERAVSVVIRLRVPSDPATDALTVVTRHERDGGLTRCVDDVLRGVVPVPQEMDVSWVTFLMLPRRDSVRLQETTDADVVAVRAAGSCWQWEDRGPCPPNKRCYADRWVRTDCGLPAMRDDVVAQFGLGTPDDGMATLVDVRLVAGDGAIVWHSPLPSEFVTHYGRNFDSAQGLSLPVAPGAFAVLFTPSTLLIADRVGVQVLTRKSGARTLSWVAPPRGKRVLWFDRGQYSIRYAKQRCEGNAHHGAFFADCGARKLFFDGYTAAVFAGDPLALVETRHLGQRGNALSGPAVAPQASLRVGGMDIAIEGQVFMD